MKNKPIIAVLLASFCIFAFVLILVFSIDNSKNQKDTAATEEATTEAESTRDDTDKLKFCLLSDGTYGVETRKTDYSESIFIPKTYKDKPVTAILDSAFEGYTGLMSITIPDSVTSIGGFAFHFCNGLTSITIPDSVTSIGEGAFADCRNLTSVKIPDSVMNIGSYTFDGCNSLTSVTVDPNNTVYHSAGNCIIETESKTLVFGCNTSVIPTDGSVTTIGNGAFCDRDSLTSITIPDSVTSIGNAAFATCGRLTSIAIPDGVTSISSSVFFSCRNLASITIPKSVTSIGEQAFCLCESLTSITYNGTKVQWNNISKDYDWNYDTGKYTIHCTDGDIEKQ